MTFEITEALWLDEHQQFSLAELAQLSGIAEADLRQLIDCAALAPADPEASEALFSAECVITVRTAQRLRRDFDLEAGALALPLLLLARIRSLEAELRALRAQVPQSHTVVTRRRS
jgi:chaperone modulatory protein CbpM